MRENDMYIHIFWQTLLSFTWIFLNVLFLFLTNCFINWNLSDFLEKAKKQYRDNLHNFISASPPSKCLLNWWCQRSLICTIQSLFLRITCNGLFEFPYSTPNSLGHPGPYMIRSQTTYETWQEDIPGMRHYKKTNQVWGITRRQTRCETSQEDKSGMGHYKKTDEVWDITRRQIRYGALQEDIPGMRHDKKTDEVWDITRRHARLRYYKKTDHV